VNVAITKLLRGVSGQDWDDVNDLATDERVAMLTVRQNALASFLVARTVHEHASLLQQFLQSKQGTMDGLDRVVLEAFVYLFISPSEPFLTCLGVSGHENLETLTDGIGGRLSDHNLGISQSNPDDFEDVWDPYVQECGRTLCKLIQVQDGGKATVLVSFDLQPLEGDLDFGSINSC